MPLDYRNETIINDLLRQLGTGASIPWPQLSCLLDAIDTTGYWETKAHSFTEWLKQNANSIGLKESTLWRYLVVGRYYRGLRKQFARVKLEYPPLEELPHHVSPEKLELLSKLARVAPKDFFEPALDMVLRNEISRDELRAKWQAFRPAMKGKTARGRGTIPPLINLKDEEQYHSVLEAMVINALRSLGSEWMGYRKAYMYDVKMHVKPDYPSDFTHRFRYIFDAVALLKPTKSAQLQVHGIEIGLSIASRSMNLLERSSYCDYFWVVINSSNNMTPGRYSIPDGVGIIEVEGLIIKVLRVAEPCNKDPENANSLLKGLLAKESRK